MQTRPENNKHSVSAEPINFLHDKMKSMFGSKPIDYWRQAWDNAPKNTSTTNVEDENVSKILKLLSEYAGVSNLPPINGLSNSWKSTFGRILSGRWNSHHANAVQKVIENSPHADMPFSCNMQDHPVQSVLELLKGQIKNESMNPDGDLAKILQVIKEKTNIDYYDLALWNAAYSGDLETVRFVLQNTNININVQFYEASILIASIIAGEIEIVEELLKHQADVNFKCKGITPLFQAVVEGNDQLVSILLKYGASINEVSIGQGTALCAAVNKNSLSTVKILIDAGCDVNLCHTNGRSPLYEASRSGYLDIVHSLLDAKAIVDFPSKHEDELTPLGIAACTGHVTIIEALITAGANVNYSSSIGRTALQFAHLHEQQDAANILVSYGAMEDVSQGWLEKQFLKYTTLLDYTQYDRNVLDDCCRRMKNGMCSGWTLWWLLKNDDVLQRSVAKWDGRKETLTAELKEYFENFAQIQWLQQKGIFLLPELSQNMSDKLINFIADKDQHCHIPFCFGFGMTREELIIVLQDIIHEGQKIYIGNLYHCLGLKKVDSHYILYDSNSGSGKIVTQSINELYLKIESILQDKKVFPLIGVHIHIIEHNDSKKIIDYKVIKDKLVDWLVTKRKKSCSLDLIDWMNSALEQSVAANDIQTVTALINAGANVNRTQGMTSMPPLFIAAQYNCVEIAKKLIQAGADVNCTWKGESPLIKACLYGNKDIIELLIQHNADITFENNVHTALSNAAGAGYLYIVKLLIQHANPMFNARMLSEAVYRAVCYGQIEVVKYLFSEGASFALSSCTTSMLHFAILIGDLRMVRLLVEECHCNVLLPDMTGITPLCAAMAGKESVHKDKIFEYIKEQAYIQRDISTHLLPNDAHTVNTVSMAITPHSQDDDAKTMKLSCIATSLFNGKQINTVSLDQESTNKLNNKR